MKPIYFFFFFLFLLLTGSRCKSPTEPKECPPDTTDTTQVIPDSTSQEFEFTSYLFGDGFNSSIVNDVWIFDENNIWAVGYFSGTDSIPATNIVKWNGKKWVSMGRVFDSAGLRGLWANDTSNIYFTSGIVLNYKDKKFEWMDFSNITFSDGQGVHKLWGSSSGNIWGIGPHGTLVHYDGISWKKIEVTKYGSNWNIYGITGNSETGIAYGENQYSETDFGILGLISSDSLPEITRHHYQNNDSFSTNLSVLQNRYILGGNYWQPVMYDLSTKAITRYPKYGSSLSPIGYSVNHIHDWYVISRNAEGMTLYHYNGIRLKMIKQFPEYDGIITHITTKNNISAFGGTHSGKGLLIIAKRKKS